MPFYRCQYFKCYLFASFFSIIFGDNGSLVQIRASFQVGIGEKKERKGASEGSRNKGWRGNWKSARRDEREPHISQSHVPLMKRNHPPPFLKTCSSMTTSRPLKVIVWLRNKRRLHSLSRCGLVGEEKGVPCGAKRFLEGAWRFWWATVSHIVYICLSAFESIVNERLIRFLFILSIS